MYYQQHYLSVSCTGNLYFSRQSLAKLYVTAQLAYLSPQQRVQFLQQLQSQPMPAGLQMGAPPQLPLHPQQQQQKPPTVFILTHISLNFDSILILFLLRKCYF